jgi:hypothetical protein
MSGPKRKEKLETNERTKKTKGKKKELTLEPKSQYAEEPEPKEKKVRKLERN